MQWHKRDGIQCGLHGKLICARDFIIINFTIVHARGELGLVCRRAAA